MSKVIAIVLALVAVLGLIVVIGALTTEGDIIVGRFILAIVLTIAAAYGAVRMWRRGNAAPPPPPA